MRLLACLFLVSSAIAAPSKLEKRTPTRSYLNDPIERRYDVNAARASAVAQTFQIGWDGYYEFAFPNDELEPVTNTFTNPR